MMHGLENFNLRSIIFNLSFRDMVSTSGGLLKFVFIIKYFNKRNFTIKWCI
jgi:hypothetical protein